MQSDVLLIVLPVFLVIGLGFGLKRTGLAGPDFLFQLNRLIYYIALPGLLFYKIATADFSARFNGELLLGLAAAIFAVFLLTLGYGRLRNWSPALQGAFCQGAFRGNLAYVGLAIVFNAYGESGFTTAGILLGFLVPLLNFLSVLALSLPHRKSGHGMGKKELVMQVVGNPLIIASFAGICWSYLSLPLPLVIDKALNIVTGMSLPLALISIGASFSFQKLKGDLGVACLVTGIKIIVLPLIAAAILLFLGVSGEELGVGVLLAGTPTATAAYILAQQMRSDAELSGAIIMLSTLCSLFTYTALLYFLRLFGG